jgi:hypothetical protein
MKMSDCDTITILFICHWQPIPVDFQCNAPNLFIKDMEQWVWIARVDQYIEISCITVEDVSLLHEVLIDVVRIQ